MSGDIEDVVLATIKMHMDKISKLEIQELLMTKFDQNEVFEAHVKVNDFEAQVCDLYKEMELVDKSESAPKIVVSAEMIFLI